MGVSSHPFSSLISLSLNDLEVLNDPSYLWSKVSVKGRRPRTRTRRVLMKRIGGSRRSRGRGAKSNNGIQSRVRTLKNLIPNSDNNMGLDGLFRETANYILSLQNRVRVMQDMVKVLTGSGGDDE